MIPSTLIAGDCARCIAEITGRLVIATHNPGKLAEMRELLAPYGVEAVSAGELGLAEPDETGTTFRPMRRIKADCRGAMRRKLPAFADDSGLAVDALEGAARHLFGALGRRDKDFTAAMTQIERLLQERGATEPDTAQRAFRLGALRRLARRPPRRGRSARRRHAGLAAARRCRLRLRSDVPARRSRRTFGEMTSSREARPAAARHGPVASRQGVRETGGDLPR